MNFLKQILVFVIVLTFTNQFTFGQSVDRVQIIGQLIDIYNKKSVKSIKIKLEGVGETVTDTKGFFSFDISKKYFKNELIISTDYPANENYAVPKYTIQLDSLKSTFNIALHVLPCFNIGISVNLYGRSPDYRNENASRCFLNTKPCTNHEKISVDNFRWKPEQLTSTVSLNKTPKYSKGYNAMILPLINNLTYPKIARLNNIQGKGIVGIVINKKGAVVSAFIKRSDASVFNQEILRVIKYFPKLKPARNANGAPVDSLIYLPFSFILS